MTRLIEYGQFIGVTVTLAILYNVAFVFGMLLLDWVRRII